MRPRSVDGKFLSAAATSAADDIESDDDSEDPQSADDAEDGSVGTGLAVAAGITALVALGWWLWNKHKTKWADDVAPKQLPAHVGEEEVDSGFNMLGLD
jgi:hypothetical protein